jgi:UDP-glucose 4-epimerase
MAKTYIVTGGAGFIGSNLARRLIGLGAKVYIFDDLSTGYKENVPKGALFYKVDVSNTRSLSRVRLPGKVNCVFHFAGQSSGEASFADPARDADVNYKATYNMLKFGEAAGSKRFIFASSMGVYGDVSPKHGAVQEDFPCSPVSYYGSNKLASERLIRIFSKDSGVNSTSFRLFNVYGPGQNMRNMKQGMVSIYLSYLMNDQSVLVKGSLSRFRDFIYVDDVSEACIRSINERRAFGETLNLGTSRRTTVKELLRLLLAAYHKKDFRKWVKVHGHTSGDVSGLTADITKLEKVLCWRPTIEMEEGIGNMKKWLDASESFWKG